MHAIHTTPGFVIGSRPYGEAGRILSIFSRGFGLVSATAQGIRLERSKLRYFCADYSFGVFSLVRGKEFWRLTSAQESDIAAPGSAEGLELLGRIALLLRRLLQGEEPHPDLFDRVSELASFLSKADAASMAALESVGVLRILHALGYVGSDQAIAPFIDQPLSTELVASAAPARQKINAHINKALKESHL